MSNRLLKINDVKIDIDSQTAIGVDFQGYDVKSPAQRKITVTNSFSVPATSRNLEVFGFADNPQSLSIKIYKRATANYWIGNERVIRDAGIRVDDIIQNSRINLFAFEKEDFWDLMKLFKWGDFVNEFLTWLHLQKGYPYRGNAFVGAYADFVEPYLSTTEGLIIPYFFGNLYNYDPDGGENYLESPEQLYLQYYESIVYQGGIPITNREIRGDGGHVCAYFKSIFEFIEYKYDVLFATGGGEFVGNIWDDSIAGSCYLPIRDINPKFYNFGGTQLWYFEYSNNNQYLPFTDVKDKGDKSLYDVVNLFFQRFNIIKDNITVGSDNYIRLARFDDLEDEADVVDWSGGLQRPYRYSPKVNGYAQESFIKFNTVFEGGDSLQGSRKLTCLNENIDATIDFFNIDEYYPPFLQVDSKIVPDLSAKEAFNSFNVFVSTGLTDNEIALKYQQDEFFKFSEDFKMQVPAVYSLDSEYQLLDKALNYPRVYTIQKWLSINDVKDLQYFRLYFFKELNGSYFLNKISGFNPAKSNNPTTLELLKVSDRSPVITPTLDYYMDGIEDPYTDGVNEFYY